MIHVHELDHIVLNVADVERALRFYADGLGLATERLEEYRRGEVPFPSVRITADTLIDLFQVAPGADRTANLHHLCLVVDEPIASIQAHLAEMGVAVVDGPTRVFGARGFGTSVYVRDPDGTMVELRSYTELTRRR